MQNKTESLIRKAENFYRRGAFERTEKICRRILKTEADNFRVLTLLGNAYFCRRDYPGAMFCYQKIEKLYPDYVVNLINLANVCFEEKQYSQAKGYAERALLSDPENAAALSLLGNALLNMKNYDEAITILTRLLNLCPLDFWAANSLSQAWQKKGNFSLAFSYALRAVEKSGGDASQQLNLNYLLYETAQEKGAASIAREVDLWERKFGSDPQVKFMIRALRNDRDAGIADSGYVNTVFDVFAADFETVLAGLDYAAPQYVSEFAAGFYGGLKWKKLRILDAGCGTGLCAPFLKKYASWHGLEGVDLSSGMLAEAARKKLYARLYCQELCAFLSGHKKRYDLIAAADVLTYFGDLDSVFAGFAFALKKNGRIIFTVTQNVYDDSDWYLHLSGRFAHRFSYLQNTLGKHGFNIEKSELKQLRTEGGEKVMGYVVSAVGKA